MMLQQGQVFRLRGGGNDAFTDSEAPDVHPVDAAWTSDSGPIARPDNGKSS
jgi:hypothetical protein